MKEASLPSPGFGSKSMHLRRIAANAISSFEVTAPKYTNGQHPGATGLVAFFTACAAAAAQAGLLNAILTFTGAGADATPEIDLPGTNQTVLTKGGSAGAATYSTSNAAVATVSGTGLITGVGVGTCTISVSVATTATYRAASASIVLTVIA